MCFLLIIFQVEEELWEEFFIESCFEEMLDDEDESYNIQSDGKTIAQEKLECLQAIQALEVGEMAKSGK